MNWFDMAAANTTAWLLRKERKVIDRTVLWSDLAGMKRVAPALSEQQIKEILETHSTMVVNAVRESTGRVVAVDGDGVLAVFDQPRAADAINTAIKLQKAARTQLKPKGVGLQIGITSGAVVEQDDGCFGPVVVLAHSLAVGVVANGILVDAATASVVDTSEIISEAGARANRTPGEYLGNVQQAVPRDFEKPMDYYEILWADERYGLQVNRRQEGS